MRRVLLSIQGISIVCFFMAFVVSFFVLDDVKEKSKLLITEKVVQSALSKVDLAEEVLNSNAAVMYLKEYQIDVIRKEIGLFRAEPYAYVASLTMGEGSVGVQPLNLETNNPMKSALFEKMFSWKQGLKSHFNETFANLVIDIRIFLGVNVIALLVAAIIGFKSTSLNSRASVLSIIITIVTMFSAFMYISGDWLIAILLNSYAGYGYAFGIIFLTAWLYSEYPGRSANQV